MSGQLDICKMILLYVDEDKDSSLDMKEMIFKNYPVQQLLLAENGVDALAINRIYHPDIYLINLELYFFDGFSLIEELLFIDRNKQIIAILDASQHIGMDKCKKMGIAYICKPIIPATLFGKVDACMENVFWKRINIQKSLQLHR